MKKHTKIILAGFLAFSCGNPKQKTETDTNKFNTVITDTEATAETKALYYNLFKAAETGYMFGHQDDLAYGVNWRYEEGRSDIKDVTGDYPAVYGWDLGRLESKSSDNIDGIPFNKQADFCKWVYKKGGVNTFSWHMNNPLTGGDSWDNTPGTVASVLPGGEKHELFKSWLDDAAAYLLSLKGDDGKLIPVLYRPYHEFTGHWFWWSKNTTTPEQFKELWKFTVSYFKEKEVHNLIYVYNTADTDINTKEDFLEYYPGDEWVDMVSFDIYQHGDTAESREKFVTTTKRLTEIVSQVGEEHNKLTALAETGFEQIPYAKWWTETLNGAIGNHKLSYVLAWRNHGWNEGMDPPHMHYYAPYKGHPYEDDFVEFYNLPNTFFLEDVTKLQLYNTTKP